MPFFRKKPVVIGAREFKDTSASRNSILAWLDKHDTLATWDADGIRIPTLEGTHLASPGDWIIRGVKGEFYPCKPDIFAATYEPDPPGSDRGEEG